MFFSNKFLQFYKYTAASFIALFIDYCVYLLILYVTSLSVPQAAVLGYLVGMVVSYILLKFKVFKEGWLSESPRTEFVLFLFSGIIGLVTTYFVTAYTIFLLGQRPQLAKIVAVIFSFVTVYFFRKSIVFRPTNTAEKKI